MDDDPKIVEIGNTFLYIYIYIYKDDSGGGRFEPHIWNTTKDIITIKLSLKPKNLYILVNFTFKNIFAHPVHRSTQL